MFLGHDLGKVFNSYHEIGKRLPEQADSLSREENSSDDDLTLKWLFIRLAAITGLLVAIILMFALFVGTFAHYY